MLVHQHQDSEGTTSDAVVIKNRTVIRNRPSGTCHSGIKLGLNGVLSLIQANGGFSAVIGEWLVNGTASGFFVQRTILSGTLEDDPGTGFLQLNADRIYDNQLASEGSKTTEVFFEVASDMSGSPIVDTATMTFISNQGPKEE